MTRNKAEILANVLALAVVGVALTLVAVQFGWLPVVAALAGVRLYYVLANRLADARRWWDRYPSLLAYTKVLERRGLDVDALPFRR